MIGEIIADTYAIKAVLGEGGMGRVYLAVHRLLGRRVAIKVLHPELAVRPAVAQRFFDEARAATLVNHPGIVVCEHYGIHRTGVPFLVMECLEGESLSARLKREKRLSVRETVRILARAARALAAAHARGIIHRDLKPANLFLQAVPPGEEDTEPGVKVLDFGIAKLTGALGHSDTHTGALLGTPSYASPEQIDDAKLVTPASDVYGLGCVAYACLTGAPPFPGDSNARIMMAHLQEAPLPPSSRVPDLPPGLDTVVLRALEKRPEDRWPTMDAFRRALTGGPWAGAPAGQTDGSEEASGATVESGTRPLRAAEATLEAATTKRPVMPPAAPASGPAGPRVSPLAPGAAGLRPARGLPPEPATERLPLAPGGAAPSAAAAAAIAAAAVSPGPPGARVSPLAPGAAARRPAGAVQPKPATERLPLASGGSGLAAAAAVEAAGAAFDGRAASRPADGTTLSDSAAEAVAADVPSALSPPALLAGGTRRAGAWRRRLLVAGPVVVAAGLAGAVIARYGLREGDEPDLGSSTENALPDRDGRADPSSSSAASGAAAGPAGTAAGDPRAGASGAPESASPAGAPRTAPESRPTAPPERRLVVRLSPPGATVRVDGEALAGRSPFTLSPAPIGAVLEIEPSAPGHVPYAKALTVSAEETGPLEIVLLPEAPARPPPEKGTWLRIDVSPAGAEVRLDGKLLGKAPITRKVPVKAGAHVVSVAPPGRPGRPIYVTAEAGKVTLVSRKF